MLFATNLRKEGAMDRFWAVLVLVLAFAGLAACEGPNVADDINPVVAQATAGEEIPGKEAPEIKIILCRFACTTNNFSGKAAAACREKCGPQVIVPGLSLP